MQTNTCVLLGGHRRKKRKKKEGKEKNKEYNFFIISETPILSFSQKSRSYFEFT